MLFKELVELLLFIQRQGVDFTGGWFSSRDEFDTMIPMHVLWKRIEGAFGKDILKIMMILRN